MLLRRYHRIHRRGHLQPRGLVMAELDGKTVKFGWSLCDNEDSFTYKEANRIARERVAGGELSAPLTDVVSLSHTVQKLPHTLRTQAASLVSAMIRHHLVWGTL